MATERCFVSLATIVAKTVFLICTVKIMRFAGILKLDCLFDFQKWSLVDKKLSRLFLEDFDWKMA